jgi:hypothetical protein
MPGCQPLDTCSAREYIYDQKAEKEGCPMLNASKRQGPDSEQRRVILLEFVAASAIFSIVALVLYMVFTYRPS